MRDDNLSRIDRQHTHPYLFIFTNYKEEEEEKEPHRIGLHDHYG
jgi:hypothetical protein